MLFFLIFCYYNSFATNYYVSPLGSNINNGLTPLTAFQTIDFAANQTIAGDTVNIGDGTYSNTSINVSGNTSGYIVFKSTNIWGAKIVSTSGSPALSINGNYIEINGLEVTNPQGHGINAENTHHVSVLNCHVYNCGNSGITLGHNPNNTIPNPCDYYRVEGNLTHNNAQLGFYSGISIYHAIALDNAPGFHIIIRNNTSHSNITLPTSSDHRDGNGIIVDDFNFTQYDAATPALGYYNSQTLIENNLCYNNGGGGIKIVWTDHVTVRNNTVYRNAVDNLDPGTYKGNIYVQQARDCKFINNISYCDPTVNPNISAIMDKGLPSGSSTIPNLWSYNLLYDGTSAGNNNIDTGDGSTPTISDNISGDPLFLVESITSTADFHLQAASPAINAGIDSDAPLTDKDGFTRTLPIDIGCYEYHLPLNVSDDLLVINEFSVYPNPASNSITLNNNLNKSKEFEIYISNVSGQVVLNNNWNSNNSLIKLDITELCDGGLTPYFLDIFFKTV